MAVVKNQKKVLSKRIEELQQRREEILLSVSHDQPMKDDDNSLSQSQSQSLIEQIDQEIEETKSTLSIEEEKHRRWRVCFFFFLSLLLLYSCVVLFSESLFMIRFVSSLSFLILSVF